MFFAYLIHTHLLKQCHNSPARSVLISLYTHRHTHTHIDRHTHK